MPSRIHQTERRDSRPSAVVAKGTPLSVRMMRGRPYSRNSRRKTARATPDAVFTNLKPDLVDRFPKGAPAERRIREELERGGSNQLAAHHHAPGSLDASGGDHTHSGGDHSHSGGEHRHSGGEHQHEVPMSDDDHGDDRRAGNAEHEDPRPSIVLGGGAHTHSGGGHSHTGGVHSHGGGTHGHRFSGKVGAGTGIDGDGSDSSGANQPAYTELFFIIRVK